MLYAILCYHSEETVNGWSKEQDDAVLAGLKVVRTKLTEQGRMGPAARLMHTTAAVTLRKGREHVVVDGPFAETKEQLLGFYVVECRDLEHAIETAREMASANDTGGAYEIRPLKLYHPPALSGPADAKTGAPTGSAIPQSTGRAQ
jgi:hypothetical protein